MHTSMIMVLCDGLYTVIMMSFNLNGVGDVASIVDDGENWILVFQLRCPVVGVASVLSLKLLE